MIVQSGEEKRSRRTAVCRCGSSFEEAEHRSVYRKIAGVELVILALLGNQLVVAAALDDAALLQHHDAVCIADGGQAVRNDKDGAAVH